jgi:TadE-like protein
MNSLFRRNRKVSRGQALVEFAIILPLLALLLLLAIDFGRVFFGWVALNNATRIAANQAALDPLAWVAPVSASDQARYRQQIINDMQAINCAPVGGGTWDVTDIPDPTFVNVAGTADAHEIGDHAAVSLRCGFTFLTPLVGSIMGNPMLIGARSEFTVRGGVINGIPVATALPSPTATPVPTPTPTATPAPTAAPCFPPQLVGMKTVAAHTAWNTAGFTGAYNITRPPNGNYTISLMSLVFGQPYPCNTAVTVFP